MKVLMRLESALHVLRSLLLSCTTWPKSPPTEEKDLSESLGTCVQEVSKELGPDYVMYHFGPYLDQMYRGTPALRLESHRNDDLLFLTWAVQLPKTELKVVKNWANSIRSQNFHLQLATSSKKRQSMEQLTLVTAAIISFLMLMPESKSASLNKIRSPFHDSYLRDFEAILNGHDLPNAKIVGQRMIHSLARVLSTTKDTNLTELIAGVLETSPPLLHALDGQSDQYFYYRFQRLPHETAMAAVLNNASEAALGHALMGCTAIDHEDDRSCEAGFGMENPLVSKSLAIKVTTNIWSG